MSQQGHQPIEPLDDAALDAAYAAGYAAGYVDGLAAHPASPAPAPLAHVDYPHTPGTLYDCPACEASGELDAQ